MTSTRLRLGATVRSKHTKKTARVVYIHSIEEGDMFGRHKRVVRVGLKFGESPMWICPIDRLMANYIVL